MLNGRYPWTSGNVNSHGRTKYINVDSFETPAFTSLIISYFKLNGKRHVFVFPDIS